MTLSPLDLAKKLKEVGLPKTLTQCLEGKDCVEWYFSNPRSWVTKNANTMFRR